jgi:hypothetical protein
VRFRTGLLIAAIIAVTGQACKNLGQKHIDEGEIYYSIEYMSKMGMMPKEIMPKNLIVSFKKNKILFDISAPIGSSGIKNLSNSEKGIYDSYINLLGFKYYYAAQPGENHPGFEAMKGIVIRKTSGTAVICGFNCKSAEVTLPDKRDKVHKVWYTTEINVKNPNAATPFSEIDGVLMSFFLVIGHVEMQFEAETVYKKEIPDKTFERREKYLRVSREDITDFINKLVSM